MQANAHFLALHEKLWHGIERKTFAFPLWGNVVNLRNAGRGLRQSEYLPFPPGPLPRSRGDGGTEFAGLRPARLLESAMISAAFFCVNICILPTECRAKPCSVWAKPTTNFSPSPLAGPNEPCACGAYSGERGQ